MAHNKKAGAPKPKTPVLASSTFDRQSRGPSIRTDKVKYIAGMDAKIPARMNIHEHAIHQSDDFRRVALAGIDGHPLSSLIGRPQARWRARSVS